MAAKARASSGKKTVAKKAATKKGSRGYATYIARVLRGATKSKVTLSGKSMKIMNSLVADFFERFATEAARSRALRAGETVSARHAPNRKTAGVYSRGP